MSAAVGSKCCSALLLPLLPLLLSTFAVIYGIAASKCPSRCWCERGSVGDDLGLRVDCSEQGLANVPAVTELDTEILDIKLDENRLSELPGHLSDAAPRLRILSAAGNAIAFLDPRLFSRLRFLRELRLSRNLLQHLDAAHLADCRDLRVLDISHNQLTQLPMELLASLPTLQAANLSHNLITALQASPPSVQSVSSQVVLDDQLRRSLDLSHNLLATVAPGFRLSDAGCPAILDLTGNHALSYTASGALKPLLQSLRRCNLVELRLRRLGLARLPTFTFRRIPLAMLRRLDLASNALATIENGALSDLTSLTHLDLSDNRLTDLPDLSDLTALIQLDLSYNLLTSLDDAIRLPPRLRHLALGSNSIRVAHPSLFARFAALEYLDLRDNGLTDFRPNERHLASLKELQLGGNQLRREHLTSIFAASRWLLRLDLSRNRISQITSNMTAASPLLRYLNLSWNGFPQIEPLDLGARQLEELDISGNRLQILADYGSPMLLRLHVRANNISTIDSLAFLDSASVQFLDLSDNPMEARSLALFKYTLDRLSGSLRVFYLNGYEIFAYLKNNAWELFRDFHVLEELELNRCNIRQPPGSAVIFPSSLKRLSLGYNPMREINSDAFRSARHLREVSLAWSHVASISAESMRSMVSLRRLNLLGNPLRCDCDRLRHFWRWAMYTNVTVVGLHSRRLRCARPLAVRGQPMLDLQLGSCAAAFTYLPTVLAGTASLVILLIAGAAYAALCRRRRNHSLRGGVTEEGEVGGLRDVAEDVMVEPVFEPTGRRHRPEYQRAFVGNQKCIIEV